jgi:hypothetical protein
MIKYYCLDLLDHIDFFQVDKPNAKAIRLRTKSDQCNFNEGISSELNTQDVRNKVIQHVKKTGHKVKIETGTSTDYHL